MYGILSGMGWLGETLIVVVVVAFIAPFIGLWVRRRWLSSRGGVFDCGMRTKLDEPSWMLGLARYEGETLEWYRVFSISMRPRLVVRRGEIEVQGRRIPDDVEQLALYASSEIVTLGVVSAGSQQVELAMSTDSLTGMLSWLEAGPRLGHQRYPGVE